MENKKKYILNPLSGRKVLYDGAKGKEVQAAIAKFFPTEHLDENIMDKIATMASSDTKVNLHMTNKFLHSKINMHDKTKFGKTNYEFFLKAVKSLKDGESFSCFSQLPDARYSVDFELVVYIEKNKLMIDAGYAIIFGDKDSILAGYPFSKLDDFDIFIGIKSNIKRKLVIKCLKYLTSVKIDSPLQKDWTAFLSAQNS